MVKLLDDFDAEYQFLDNDGPVFWIKTDLDAPRGRVIAIDTRHPERAAWKTIVPQGADKLDHANVVNDTFLLSYLKDAQSEVRIYSLEGKLIRTSICRELGRRKVSAESARIKRRFTLLPASSPRPRFTATIWRQGSRGVFRQPKVDFDSSKYETKQVFYKSKDGTRVPMFITAKKGLKLDGQNPVLLYAYGGFNISMTPAFSVGNGGLARNGWRLRAAQPARRRRIRRGMAPGGNLVTKTERV